MKVKKKEWKDERRKGNKYLKANVPEYGYNKSEGNIKSLANEKMNSYFYQWSATMIPRPYHVISGSSFFNNFYQLYDFFCKYVSFLLSSKGPVELNLGLKI